MLFKYVTLIGCKEWLFPVKFSVQSGVHSNCILLFHTSDSISVNIKARFIVLHGL